MVSLTFSDVTKRFGGRTVIEGLSATLAGGTVTAVTGANGSGKSTLLKMAANIFRWYSKSSPPPAPDVAEATDSFR